MKPGDLVIRKVGNIDVDRIYPAFDVAMEQRKRLGHGIVLSTFMGGNPQHRCLSVFYPRSGKIYDIAESLMVVISEGR